MNERLPRSPSRIARLALNVADITRSAAFYEEALGFRVLAASEAGPSERVALLGGRFESLTLSLGAARLELSRFLEGSTPYPARSLANDLWFQHFAVTCNDIDALADAVARLGAEPITCGGPQKLPAASGGVTAYKFRDPDGHPLELLVPTGDAKDGIVTESKADNTATIDHTAMSVADTGHAIAFYQEILGLDIGGDQINTGIEQDRLDGLSGTRVRVVSLRARAPGPHLELLGYERPRGRNGAWTPTDIAATRTVFEVADLQALERRLEQAGAEIRRAADAVLGHDPDGHWLLFEQKG